MISMTTIKSAGGASKYMTEQATSEYYAGQAVPAEWAGKGAELQCLVGEEVSTEILTQQLEGKVRERNEVTGEIEEKQLGRIVNGELQHRAGWDLTFAAPKSVSIESEVFGRDAVRKAHEDAVKAAMKFLEDKASQARIGGEFIKTGNLTYATFQHATSRAGDPQTHTHVIVANVTFDQAGKAYSLSNEKLMDFRTSADALYKNQLANELDRLGYKIEFDRNGNFEIAGYSKEHLEVFSKRNEQIKDALAERGMHKDSASHAARQVAALDTRQDKDHPENALAHRDKWHVEAKAAGIKQVEPDPTGRGYAQQGDAKKAVEQAINHLTEREMAFKEKDLYREVAKFCQGRAALNQLEKEIQVLKDSGRLVERTDGKFSTKHSINAEKEMEKHLADGHGAHEAVMEVREFERALEHFEKEKGFELTPEQRSAARMILTGDDRFQGVQGLAGTGKTTLLEFVRIAAESKGWVVQGFSNGGAQAEKMQQESGILSDTTARFILDFQKAEHDALLARQALDTYEERGGLLGTEPNFTKLMLEVKEGRASLHMDSAGRSYITDKSGATYTKALFNQVKEFQSPNMDHFGLTNSKYVITDHGVFKQGGSLLNEAAASFMDKVHESAKDDRIIGKSAKLVAQYTIGQADKWQKVGHLEANAVRAEALMRSVEQRREEYRALEIQASKIGSAVCKTLNICDEASMSGQREFNRVIDVTEKTGARTVYLGDQLQHQSVEAGKAFEQAQKHMPMSYLGAASIRRQTTDLSKAAVANVLMGHHSDAVASLPTREFRANQDAVREKYAVMEALTAKQKEEGKVELREAARADNSEVIKVMAKDYVGMDRAGRDKTLVITSTNTDRNAINSEIRNNMKAQGELNGGKQISTLEKAAISKEESMLASNFEKGQVIVFLSNYKALGVGKGDLVSVERIDSRTNTITARCNDGREFHFNPERIQGKEVYNERKGKEFACGDRMAFTKNDNELGVKNGQTGTVEKFDGKNMTVKLDSGGSREFNTQAYKHIDHAYAVTSFKAQGQTVDRVMVHHNTERGQHGDRETYVNLTREREDVTMYTQNAEKAAVQAGVKLDKEVANIHEATRPESSKLREDVSVTASKPGPVVETITTAMPVLGYDAELAQRALETAERTGYTQNWSLECAPHFDQLKASVEAEAGNWTLEKDSFGREYFTNKDGDTFTADVYGSKYSEIVEQSMSSGGEVAPKDAFEVMQRDSDLARAALNTAEQSGYAETLAFSQVPDFEQLKMDVAVGDAHLKEDSSGREYFIKDGETYTKDAFNANTQALVEQANQNLVPANEKQDQAIEKSESKPELTKESSGGESKAELLKVDETKAEHIRDEPSVRSTPASTENTHDETSKDNVKSEKQSSTEKEGGEARSKAAESSQGWDRDR